MNPFPIAHWGETAVALVPLQVMLPGYGYINLSGDNTKQVQLPGYGYLNGV